MKYSSEVEKSKIEGLVQLKKQWKTPVTLCDDSMDVKSDGVKSSLF